MKKFCSLFCACLFLSLLVPMMGCGGSGSSDSAPAQSATVVQQEGQSRAVRVNWTKPSEDKFTVVEYQVVRWTPSAAPVYTVVGVASPGTTTFLDTAETRDVTYFVQTPLTDGEGVGAVTEKAFGLSQGSYAYKVRALCRFPNGGRYIHATVDVSESTNAVSFP